MEDLEYCPYCGAAHAPGNPCLVCDFQPDLQSIPDRDSLQNDYLPIFDEMRDSFDQLHRELQGYARSRVHHGWSLQASHNLCVLLAICGALLLLNRIVVQRLPISEAGTAMIVILFAACLDFMVRHNNENRIRRRLRAIFMLQKQLESDGGESFLPLAFAYCHPAVLRRILAMDGDVSECVRILRQQAAALAEKNAGRFPIRPLEQEALIQLALWDLCTTKESEESV